MGGWLEVHVFPKGISLKMNVTGIRTRLQQFHSPEL